MPHLLDNMIWHALDTGDKRIASHDNGIAIYHSDVASFGGMREYNDRNFKRLYDWLPDNGKVAVSSLSKASYDEEKWLLLKHFPCCQMVYDYPVSSFAHRNSKQVVRLSNEHIPQMLELTALTKPGPFLQRTIEFGNYFGVFVDGKLAAMSGQRMHPVPYLEVSAVCTHPDFRGQGYAKACMLEVMKCILDNSFIPFLHVLNSNQTAIQLYESLGFRIRKEINIDMIKKKPA